MKYLNDEQLLKYRESLLAAERGVETALQTMSEIEQDEKIGALWEDLNHAYALIQTGLRKEHLLRDWGGR